MTPQRIQLRRTKGWRKPEGAVVVSRPSRWGNPYSISRDYDSDTMKVGTRAEAVALYERAVRDNDAGSRFHRECPTSADIRAHLVGLDLACWCPLSEPCHADVLLSIAAGGAA